MKLSRLRPITTTACLGGALLGGAPLATAQAPSAANAGRLEKLEKENEELRKRLDALEGIAPGATSGGGPKAVPVKALSSINVSGFVTASYFYNSTKPADRNSDGYLWNTTHNSFSLNKVKLALASPAVERSGEKWDAGYRASFILGEDANLVDTGLGTAGFGNVREAFVELNVPVGTGLNIKAGHLISLLNYESGDGGAVNANFSQGNQWWFTGNGPAAGIQLGYTLTDWLDVKFRVHNGLRAGAVDGNGSKGVMGAIGIKPNDKTWFSLIGFGGGGFEPLGGSLLAGHQLTDQLNLGFEFDYFIFEKPAAANQKVTSVGAWVSYDFTPKLGVAFRGDYLHDPNGSFIDPATDGGSFPGRAGSGIGLAPATPSMHGDLSSLTLTLNWKPMPNIKVQPEVRYDRTSYVGGLDGKKDRVIFGAGVSYIF